MVLAIIQARLGSSRLPRKALMDVGGETLIARVVGRARQIRGVDRIIVATPSMADTEEMLFRGDVGVEFWCDETLNENDVLGRFARCAARAGDYDTVMRLTADCGLLNPTVAEHVLTLYRESHAWYAWNIHPGYTDGEDVEVFKREALMRAHIEATDPSDREHVTPWIRRNYPVVTLKPTGPQQRKTSIDTEEDLTYVRSLVAKSR